MFSRQLHLVSCSVSLSKSLRTARARTGLFRTARELTEHEMRLWWTSHKAQYQAIEQVPLLVNEDVSLCHSPETDIRCTFLGGNENELYKSTRGVINDEPVALIFIQLEFPQFCRSEVDFADVLISFSDSEGGGSTIVKNVIGPTQLCGQQLTREGNIVYRVMPEITVMDKISLSGMGLEKSQDNTVRARWTFKCQRTSDTANRYRGLKCEWRANRLQSEVSRTIHLGFLLSHDAERLKTEVMISGKLNAGFRYGSFKARSNPTTMTLVLGKQSQDFGVRARGLRQEMETKNGAEGPRGKLESLFIRFSADSNSRAERPARRRNLGLNVRTFRCSVDSRQGSKAS